MTSEILPPKPRKLTPLLNQRKADILPINENTSSLAVLGSGKHTKLKRGEQTTTPLTSTMNKLEESCDSLENISKIGPTSNETNDAIKKYDCIWDTKSLAHKPPPPSSSSFNRKFNLNDSSSHIHSRSSLGGRISKNDNKEIEFQNLFKILHLNSNDIMNGYVYNNTNNNRRIHNNTKHNQQQQQLISRQANFHKIKIQKSSSFVLNPSDSYLTLKRHNSFTSF